MGKDVYLTKLSDAEVVALNKRIFGLFCGRQQATTYKELARVGVGESHMSSPGRGRWILAKGPFALETGHDPSGVLSFSSRNTWARVTDRVEL